ncbi:PREDICTED: LOB domain-containing protein 36 isoform X1 [Erythranthe guttata]|nr:PREDICTED: LOB domain-containing protein 36 isoform X1 [Erythranthe guttata]|eukprot:XP_012853105.1 PREDICTED: LOB domain-containing protein 36 isoform X1 [Erythranthe guttata]
MVLSSSVEEALKKKTKKMSSSNSPCAACKCLRRKCTQECVFAPYFPPDNPQKFTNVHKVFGASNVAKLLNELNAAHREDAVNSLAYEAEQRLRDPVYGCVGQISILQQRLKQVQIELDSAKKELSAYIGPAALMPMLNNQGFLQHHSNFNPAAAAAAYQMVPYNVQQMMGPPTGVPHGAAQLMIRGGDPHHPHHQHHQQQQQQFLEAQQLAMAAAAAAREQEMLRTFEHQQNHHQQQHSELVRFNNGFDDDEVGGPVTATGFNQMVTAAAPVAAQPSLALGNAYETIPYHQIQHQQQEHSHNQTHMLSHHPHQIQLQPQDLLQQQQQHIVAAHHQQQHQQQQHQLAAAQTHATQSQQQQQPMRAKSEEGRSI